MIWVIRKLLLIPDGATGKREIAAVAYIWSQYLIWLYAPKLDSSDKADLIFWNAAIAVVMVLGAFGFEAVLRSPLVEKLAGIRSGKTKDEPNFPSSHEVE